MPAETNLEKIIARLKAKMPLDQFPQDGDESVRTMIADACDEINKRRGTQTVMKKTTLLLTPDEDFYTLPEDCVKVIDLIPYTEESSLALRAFQDFPPQVIPSFYYGGCLPTGQSISPSIDLIRRMAAQRDDREVTWRHVGTQLELLMAIGEDTSAELVYRAVDRDSENVPERFWSKIELYVRSELLKYAIARNVGVGDISANGLLSKNLQVLMDLARDDWRRWETFLSGISPEQGTDQALME